MRLATSAHAKGRPCAAPNPQRRPSPLLRPLRAGGPLLEGMLANSDPSVSVAAPLLGDMISRPHLALGIALPLWVQLLGLLAVNFFGFQAVEAMLRANSDKSDRLSVVKLQVRSDQGQAAGGCGQPPRPAGAVRGAA